MDYKQKAEAYVRAQLPELMELSFGCEVEIRSIVKKQKKGLLVTKSGFYTVHIGKEGYVYDIQFGEVSIKNADYKIIGHPIQLSDWLRVLSGVKQYGFRERLHIDATGLCGHLQSKNGGVVFTSLFRFNLATGQPDTPADYQAFCNIVGI